MKNCIKILLTTLVIFASHSFAEACSSGVRDIEYFGKSMLIYVSPSSDSADGTHISFPERDLVGAIKQNPNGIKITPHPEITNMFSVSVDDIYSGMLFVHGKSGEIYTLDIRTRESCPDRLVKIIAPREVDLQDKYSDPKSDENATLMQYLWHAFDPGVVPPPGYRRITYHHKKRQDRLVYTENGVHMYIDTVYEGPAYTGYIFELENKSRQAAYFNFDNIDFHDRRIKELLGTAREVSMIPASRNLDPAPEFVEDIYSHLSRGYFYVVAETKRDGY